MWSYERRHQLPSFGYCFVGAIAPPCAALHGIHCGIGLSLIRFGVMCSRADVRGRALRVYRAFVAAQFFLFDGA
jgi:hypothetical protein